VRQTVAPGKQIEALTPDEARELLRAEFRQTVEHRVRAEGNIRLDANGNGTIELYTVPQGFEFDARRVTLDLDQASDPSTGAVVLNAAGKFIEYLRAGERIEYGQPQYGASVQVPGAQTWSREQGPYLRNGETFEVAAHGLTAAGGFRATVEGILRRPPPRVE
jgi:hypothetical protein